MCVHVCVRASLRAFMRVCACMYVRVCVCVCVINAKHGIVANQSHSCVFFIKF